MSGLIIESESDSEDNTISSPERTVSKGHFVTNFDISSSQQRKQPSERTHDVYKVQEKLEDYTRRLSQLGLGLDSDGSSSMLSRKGSRVAGDSIHENKSQSLNRSPELLQPVPNPNTLNPKEGDEKKSVTPEVKRDIVLSPSKSPGPKIQIKFQPIGSITPMKPSTCKISADKPFSTINIFLKKRLKVENVFCYINNSFAPSPNQRIGDLWAQFKVSNELIVSYCAIVAFG